MSRRLIACQRCAPGRCLPALGYGSKSSARKAGQAADLSKSSVSTVSRPGENEVEQCEHTTHLVDLGLVHLVSSPGIALDLLRIHLPFGKEADLRTYGQSFAVDV